MKRRGFLTGLSSALAAPAIIRTPGLLMPIRPVAKGWTWLWPYPAEKIYEQSTRSALMGVATDAYSISMPDLAHYEIRMPALMHYAV